MIDTGNILMSGIYFKKAVRDKASIEKGQCRSNREWYQVDF